MTQAELVSTYETRLSRLSGSPRMSVSVEDMAVLLRLARSRVDINSRQRALNKKP